MYIYLQEFAILDIFHIIKFHSSVWRSLYFSIIHFVPKKIQSNFGLTTMLIGRVRRTNI